MVADPLHEKFLVFMLRSKSTHKVPAQINANINTKLLKSFNEGLIDSCKQYGVAAATCEKFQIRPAPTQSEYYSALFEKEQQQHGFRCTSVESDARKFVRDHLPSILSTARENEKLKSGDVVTVARKLALQTRDCARLESMARGTGVKFEGEVRKSSDLFGLLDPLVNIWSYKTPSEVAGSSTMIDRIEALAKEVLAGQ